MLRETSIQLCSYGGYKMNKNDLEKGLKDFEKCDELEQSLAFADIIKDLLETTKIHLNRVYVILTISIISNLIMAGAFLYYEYNMITEVETSTVTETTTTQTVEGENSQINNVEGNQYNDSSTHNEG